MGSRSVLISADRFIRSGLACMRLANRDGKRIGGIVDDSCILLQVKENPRHLQDLILVGAAVSRDGKLNLHRRVLIDRNPRSCARKNDNSASLRRPDRRCGVAGKE